MQEYRCEECGKRFNAEEKPESKASPKCPGCGGTSVKTTAQSYGCGAGYEGAGSTTRRHFG
ncbi:MAG: hypothetical protein HYX87_07375 [Chloroflexi bacterium]|nr:hypothetical protein [Chloroflexota bacterium]